MNKSRDITVVYKYPNNVHLYFPDLNITCNGNVTHVLFGARKLRSTKAPQFQFVNHSNAIIRDIEVLASEAVEISDNLFMINLTTPVPVEAGYYLALYQPNNPESSFLLYQQWHNGPKNYDHNLHLISEANNYPLVSFIIGKRY